MEVARGGRLKTVVAGAKKKRGKEVYVPLTHAFKEREKTGGTTGNG